MWNILPSDLHTAGIIRSNFQIFFLPIVIYLLCVIFSLFMLLKYLPISIFVNTFFHDATASRKPGLPHYQDFTIKLRNTSRGRNSLAKRSSRLRELNLTTHNNHKRQSYTPPAGFKPTIPASEQSQCNNLLQSMTQHVLNQQN